MGGYPPLGYDAKDRKLVINQGEAQTIRDMYERFLVLKSITHLAAELRDQGLRFLRRCIITAAKLPTLWNTWKIEGC